LLSHSLFLYFPFSLDFFLLSLFLSKYPFPFRCFCHNFLPLSLYHIILSISFFFPFSQVVMSCINTHHWHLTSLNFLKHECICNVFSLSLLCLCLVVVNVNSNVSSHSYLQEECKARVKKARCVT
jgi:hypothetical protein